MKKYKVKELYAVKLGRKGRYQVKQDEDAQFFIAYGERAKFNHPYFTLITNNYVKLPNMTIDAGEGERMVCFAVPLALYVDKNKDYLTLDEILDLEINLNNFVDKLKYQSSPNTTSSQATTPLSDDSTEKLTDIEDDEYYCD